MESGVGVVKTEAGFQLVQTISSGRKNGSASNAIPQAKQLTVTLCVGWSCEPQPFAGFSEPWACEALDAASADVQEAGPLA